VAHVDDYPDFDYLVYVWGPPRDERSHLLIDDNKLLRVRPTVVEALRTLRHRDTYRLVWIDSICICLKDASEKTQQVGLLGRILASSTRAIIWPGSQTPFSGEALDAIDQLYRARKDEIDDPPFSSISPRASALTLSRYRQRLLLCEEPQWRSINDLLAAQVLQRYVPLQATQE